MKKGILAVVALAAATSVHAADYMLNVPVNVSNLTLGHALYLNCRLCKDPRSPGPNGPRSRCPADQGPMGNNIVAHTSAAVPLVNGSYSGTMQVVFANLSSHDASRAKFYGCELSTSSQGGGGPQGITVPSTLIKPNSSPVTWVDGTVQ